MPNQIQRLLCLFILALINTSCSPNLDLNSMTTTSKWLSGKELFSGEDQTSPEAKAVIAAFDRDNGKIYCIPKMKDAELGEMKVSFQLALVSAMFAEHSKKTINEIDFDKPIESMLRLSLKKKYPCK